MKVIDLGHLDRDIARARIVLSLIALASWYIDPSDGFLRITNPALIVLALHFTYALTAYGLYLREVGPRIMPQATIALDILFAGMFAYISEGPTSPSWLLFIFAIAAVGCRIGFRAALWVTIASSVFYFLLLALSNPGEQNPYLMRAAYLAATGYLIGLLGQQRANFEV